MRSEETDYDKQAKDFLNKTQTTFKATYLKHGVHFVGDKDKRDIYEITLKRGNREYSFKFGQSINKSHSTEKRYREQPSEYDVLACLTKYDPESFKEFCSAFGFDEDSRKAERTYKAVCEEWLNIQKLWTDAEIELLQEIN